ncbi:MAG: universal stress protein [Dehalococcoidia bacterium]|nr:universal stress protein [Dehalococcoidia bacterium]
MRLAIGLAKEQTVELWSLSVEEHLPHYAAAIGEFEEIRAEKDEFFRDLLGQAAELAAAQGIHLRTEVQLGHAMQTIVGFASQNALDLIVMGHSGYSGVWGAFLGTTTDKVSRHAPCSLLIVR